MANHKTTQIGPKLCSAGWENCGTDRGCQEEEGTLCPTNMSSEEKALPEASLIDLTDVFEAVGKLQM